MVHEEEQNLFLFSGLYTTCTNFNLQPHIYTYSYTHAHTHTPQSFCTAKEAMNRVKVTTDENVFIGPSLCAMNTQQQNKQPNVDFCP